MDSSVLKVLVEIAKCNNITKAAQNMGYTQSGLSHTLNRVEEELGFKLFVRSKKGVMLTKEGRDILPIAKEIEASMEKLHETITSIQGLKRGKITIGSFSSISMNVLPPVLMAFNRDYPGIKIDLMEGSVTEIKEWIIDRTVDLGFTSIQEDDPFEYKVWFEDPMVAVLPVDYPLTDRETFDINDFVGQPFIMTAAEKGNDCDIERSILKNNLKLDIKLSSKSTMAILQMVARGLGLSIMPELITLGHENGIKTLPIAPYACRRLGMGYVSLKNASPATKKFIEYTDVIIEQRKMLQKRK